MGGWGYLVENRGLWSWDKRDNQSDKLQGFEIHVEWEEEVGERKKEKKKKKKKKPPPPTHRRISFRREHVHVPHPRDVQRSGKFL